MITIRLLGGFEVRVDGEPVQSQVWNRKSTASLVKLLALAPLRRMHREEVIDALWPDSSVVEAGPRLHKAAHYARRALRRSDAVVLAGETVSLLPDDAEASVDVVEFEAAARAALAPGAPDELVDRALALHTGELLPQDVHETWVADRRDLVRHLHLQLLRFADRWDDLLVADPADEEAHIAIMIAHIEHGQRAAALAQYDLLERVLDEALGVAPSARARAVRDRAIALHAENQWTAPSWPTQQVRFCRGEDGTRLAYAEAGSGPPLVKSAHWLTHLEYDWDSATWRHWLQALTSRFRLLRYDPRGCGLSEWRTPVGDVATWSADLGTVVDAAGFDRFPLLGVSQGAAVAIQYAVTHPERVSALVLYGGYSLGRLKRARTEEERRSALLRRDLAALGWGTEDPSFRQVFAAQFMPGGTREQWSEFNDLQRRTTSPENAAQFIDAFNQIDVTESARRIRCPTLVVHLRGDRLPPIDEGRHLASLIPGARLVTLEGDNHLMLADDPAWPRFLEEIDGFLAATAA